MYPITYTMYFWNVVSPHPKDCDEAPFVIMKWKWFRIMLSGLLTSVLIHRYKYSITELSKLPNLWLGQSCPDCARYKYNNNRSSPKIFTVLRIILQIFVLSVFCPVIASDQIYFQHIIQHQYVQFSILETNLIIFFHQI